ncbi:MAG: tRNA pseudouridine(38-40) synthase TruA [Planctomycetes bacterium]|nr:tRNA pseudouridine(38-40) synthase TruA [Planctomycetota bacterium]
MTEEVKRNVRLTIEYEGTEYAGWQCQDDQPTVQAAMIMSIEKALGERVIVYGASRTDSGVHSRGQTANFRTSSQLAAWKIGHALNSYLPEDIAVVEVSDAPDDFHAQFNAKGKWYRYMVRNEMYRSAVDRAFSHLVRGTIDVTAMQEAAKRLVGKHDFRAFATQVTAKKNTVRTMKRVEWTKEGSMLTLDVEGDGFLYNMVRTFAGTMLKIGGGAWDAARMDAIIESKDRKQAGPVAAPCGLTLMRVYY